MPEDVSVLNGHILCKCDCVAVTIQRLVHYKNYILSLFTLLYAVFFINISIKELKISPYNDKRINLKVLYEKNNCG